ncbi:MAG: response regulator, partial [FCB group bacterium]|nr:response regulator [FCB group bacterium]
DNDSSQRLIKFFLKGLYRTSYAVSVSEAKRRIKKDPVDLVLLDLSLIGDEDGLDFVRYLRNTKKWKNLPVIAVTAHAFTTDRDNCLKAGCDDYLSKPIRRQVLLSRIDKLIKRNSNK